MNQLCKVCGEPAAGFHFGAFTCEGCKSFFGRTYNNIAAIAGCKNNGDCVINKKNRTSCKACRLRKCLLVGMSKSGSRYGRRSNWFKIHCLLQEQQQQQQHQQSHTTNASEEGGGSSSGGGGGEGHQNAITNIGHSINNNNSNNSSFAHLDCLNVRQTYQDKTNPSIKTAAAAAAAAAATASHSVGDCHTQTLTSTVDSSNKYDLSVTPPTATSANQQALPSASVRSFLAAAKFLNGLSSHTPPSNLTLKLEARLSDTPSDSGASSATVEDNNGDCGPQMCNSQINLPHQIYHQRHHHQLTESGTLADIERRKEKILQIFCSHSDPLRSAGCFAPYIAISTPPLSLPQSAMPTATTAAVAAAVVIKEELKRLRDDREISDASVAAAASTSSIDLTLQDEPIDLSLKYTSRKRLRSKTPSGNDNESCNIKPALYSPSAPSPLNREQNVVGLVMHPKLNPLDLTLGGHIANSQSSDGYCSKIVGN